MTREEVLEIDAYCQEHKVSYRQRLEELEIPFWNFYKAKKKYRLQDEAAATDGNMSAGFVQLGTGGGFVPAMPPPRGSRSAARAKQSAVPAESYVTVELRTPNGTAMRIQGSMTATHLREIISAGNVQS